MKTKALLNYYHTFRYLRPTQIYGRVLAKVSDPAPSPAPAPAERRATGLWVATPERAPVMIGPEQFRFLNETHSVPSADGWNFSSSQKVSQYNLHYFDDLSAEGAPGRCEWHRAIIERWIAENPVGTLPGWESYPSSLRIVNWIKWSLAGNSLSKAALHSLAVQTRYLRSRLERKLLGNHLLANAKALVFAGLFFDGPEAEQWLHTGLTILEQQLPEQILGDGGHFERSPMYQCVMLEDTLDLINIHHTFGGALPDRWRGLAQRWSNDARRMRHWLKVMTHPDGGVSFFNDSALGIAPTSDELERYATDLGLPAVSGPDEGITYLPETGYIRLQRGSAVALLDTAPIGPDYLPAHAHADTLSFELSLYGRRVFVNSGTSTYAISPQRHWERSTGAHNTVVVNGENSSEVWASFRVARRGYPIGLQIDQARTKELIVTCSHDGYRRLKGRPVHKRTWRLTEYALDIDDQISGGFTEAEAIFHLHPDITVERRHDSHLALCSHGRSLTFAAATAASVVKDSTFHPEFGLSIPSRTISADLSEAHLTSSITW